MQRILPIKKIQKEQKSRTVSVVIVTKNRPEAVRMALTSLMHGTILPKEVIVINQGNPFPKTIEKEYSALTLQIVPTITIGLSAGRNLGITLSTGDIVCFTDDDCIVSRTWISEISSLLSRYPKAAGVFGNVVAYPNTAKKGYTCPCTFTKRGTALLTEPSLHMDTIGFGNNMAFRKRIFSQKLRFLPWLGAGSIGKSAEDADFAFRLLATGHTIIRSPKVRVYHNRWLTKEEAEKQDLAYFTGQVACYLLLALHGNPIGKQTVLASWFVVLRKGKFILTSFHWRKVYDFFRYLSAFLWGSVICSWYYSTDANSRYA